MPVSFLHSSENFSLQKKAVLKKWISAIIKQEKKKEGKIIFLFCNDKKLHSINKEFLNHDTLTDIITFDYSEGEKISGEIYISTERVFENAEKFSGSFLEELHRVMIHGVLHLCGYKDKSPADKKQMRQKEEEALKKVIGY
ncbi:MAG: rRNA maturation RNase YbeY [Bacteroidia bacterium]|nr:rRNA maturation RNase YbeY [Bacteroidia bacterium]